ncbi:unnamed protein product [Caretta caretta]
MAGQISESDQIKQFKEFLGTYNKLTETCFLDCVKDFTSREVKSEEMVSCTFLGSIWHWPLLGTGYCIRWTTDDVLRTLPTEIFKNDAEDIHEISGVSYSAE